MTTLLLFGFLIGMRHALEADHLAAVAAISTKEHSLRASIKHGVIWGLGHTTTLFLFGSIVIFMNTVISQQMADKLEFAVGIMLVLLGFDVLRRMIKERIHYHTHRHQNLDAHFHAHSHSGDIKHSKSEHEHSHNKFPYRTLFIGFMHGLAGSAALILLTLDMIESVPLSMVYILLFGVGSIAGMAVLSVVIAVPLRASSKLTWLHNSLQISIGILTVGLGTSIIYQSNIWFGI
ncbi:MAG: high frequency lysogenization protein HflD [Methylophaga sp.]|nr:high frequency lysogenization protein HflD [Methylophaga sp.]